MSATVKLDKKTKEALFKMMPLIGKTYKFTPSCFDNFPEEFRPIFTMKVPTVEERGIYLELESGDPVVNFLCSIVLSISNAYNPITEDVSVIENCDLVEYIKKCHPDIIIELKDKIHSSMKINSIDYASLVV